MERHRFLYLALRNFQREALLGRVVLDVAPSDQLSAQIRALRPEGYLSIDFDPSADGRHVTVAASLTSLPLPDASAGLIVCFHVLEHIPDDRAAMAEIRRVLAPGGVALVQVPWRPGPTDEDPDAPADERLRRFGQRDHVRYYGDDFTDRLRDARLHIDLISPGDLLAQETCAVLGLNPAEQIWLCYAASSRQALDPTKAFSLAESLEDLIRRATQTWEPPAVPPTKPTPANRRPRAAWIPKPVRAPLRRIYRKVASRS